MPRALTYQQRLDQPRIMGNLAHRGPGTTMFVLELQGANVVANELFGAAAIFPDFVTQLLDVAADIGIDEARRFVQVETGATRDSINKQPGVWAKPERGEWSIRYGPTTFYSPFLEYGTVHARPYPFMIPSADIVQPLFVAAVGEFVSLIAYGRSTGAGGRITNHPTMQGNFTAMRTFLYSTSKFLGDVAVFGGRRILGPPRAMMLSMARGLGDISSTMNNTLGSRFRARLTGRVSGHIVGFGSASLSHSKTYSGFIGGTAGHRIYQRAAGRFTNLGLSRNNLPTNVGF